MATVPPTTPETVKAVYSDVLPSNEPQLAAAITTANLMVQQIVDSGCGANYSPEQLENMQNYLAAHFFQIQTGVIISKSAGSASESYQMNTDFFLKGTLHGQTAMLLDTNNCLAQRMADTELAIQGRQSFPPSLVSLHSNKQKGFRGRC